MLGETRRDIAVPFKGQLRPTEESISTGISPALAGFNGGYEYLYAILYLLTEKPASILVFKQEDESRTRGDGLKTLEELVGKYKKVTEEVIRATRETLVNTSMKQGHDPDNYFTEKTLARSGLEKRGEPISNRRFKAIYLQGVPAECKDINLTLYREPTWA